MVDHLVRLLGYKEICVMMQWIVVWGVSALTATALAAVFAGIKNRDYSYWMAWCFILPPLVIWLMLMPKNSGPRPRQPRLDEIDRDQHTGGML